MKEKQNCREYCRFARYCYQKGENGLDPDDCPYAWRIEDMIVEARHQPKEDENEYFEGTC